MAILDRITYATIGAILGAFIGVACWWLYGLANSLSYFGSGIDPVLRHWLTYSCGAFATIGFVFRQYLGNAVGDTISAIFHFELNLEPEGRVSPFFLLVFWALIIAAIWFTVPS